MTLPNELVILGAGGFAHEVLSYIEPAGVARILFVDETAEPGTSLSCGGNVFDVASRWDEIATRNDGARFQEFLVAVGSPVLKRKLVASALAIGLRPAPTFVHPHASIYGADVAIGRGGIIAPGCRLTVGIRVGDYASIGLNVLIGHGAALGDYVTCNPGALISGDVTLGSGVLLGAGSCIREKIRIADDVTVGAQACVVRDITMVGATVVGIPAAPIRLHE